MMAVLAELIGRDLHFLFVSSVITAPPSLVFDIASMRWTGRRLRNDESVLPEFRDASQAEVRCE